MTLTVQSRHFCFCIPVRFGVFVLSFWSLVASGLTASVFWLVLSKGSANGVKLASNLKAGIIIAGVLYTLFALISLAGLVGSLIRSRALVRTFSIFLWFQLFASLAYSIAITVAMFDKSLQNHLVQECIKQSNNTVTTVGAAVNMTLAGNNETQAEQTADQIRKSCQSIFTPNNGWLIFGFFVFFLLTLYSCVIVRRYGKQLGDEQSYITASSNASVNTETAFQPSYYPHTPLSRVEPGYGAGSSNAYPFAQREHGFGAGNNVAK